MFDVFLERPHDTTPEGRERLARALAQHYRIDPDVFRKPIVAGRRLRVKANVDDRAARALARELEGFGALVSITAHADPGRPSKAAETVPSSSGMNFTLTTLDGDIDEAGPMPSLSVATPAAPPPKPPAPAPRATASSQPAAAPPPRPSQDMFAPPDDSEQPLELQLMPAKQGTVARDSGALPARESAAPPARPPSAAQAAVVEDEVPPAPPPPERRRLEIDLSSIIDRARNDPRGRLVAGLALGLLVGFLPAQLYASIAEDKLDEIGAQLAKEPPPQTEAEYQLMLQQFDLAERRSERVKTRIMVVTGALWLLAGAGATYGYWRFTGR